MSGPVADGTGPGDGAERGGVIELEKTASGASRRDPPPQAGGGGRAGRFWSSRRIPAALTAAVLTGATGLLLYDIAAVRAGHSAMYWRRRLAEQLAQQPLSETWVQVAACAAMALGVWLLLLALTPGLRALLPMRRGGTVRAGLDREAAGLALRDRAMEVSGVQSARVRMGRRKARVRARSHFRALDEVRDDLEAALDARVGDLGLARRPSLKVDVHRPKKKG
jgi:hypothetical protein